MILLRLRVVFLFIDFSALLIRSLLVDVSHVKEHFHTAALSGKAKQSIPFSVVGILLYNRTVLFSPLLRTHIFIFVYCTPFL